MSERTPPSAGKKQQQEEEAPGFATQTSQNAPTWLLKMSLTTSRTISPRIRTVSSEEKTTNTEFPVSDRPVRREECSGLNLVEKESSPGNMPGFYGAGWFLWYLTRRTWRRR